MEWPDWALHLFYSPNRRDKLSINKEFDIRYPLEIVHLN